MRKRPINIIGGFYRDPNLHWSRQDTLNWIPVRAEQEGTLTPFQLRDAPGVKPFVRITKTVQDGDDTAVIDVGPGRGIRNVEGKLFVVAAQTLYQISNTGVAIPFGTIPGVGRVSMAHNQFGLANQLITVNGSAGYVFNTNTQTLVKITDEGYPGAFIADYIDQYLAQVEPQGRFWFHSDLANGTDYNTLDRYEAEADPDRIVSLIVSHREVLVFGRDTIEPFVNTGGQTGTFERASNTVIEVGCAAKFTPRKLDNSVFWLDDKRLVRRLDGYTPIRVSTDAIDAAFAECTANQVATAYAFTWETRGHKVYYITVPGMFTFGYDVLTGQWPRPATGGMAHGDVIDLAFWYGKWIALSGQNGLLYELDQNYKLDRCDPLVRKRTTGKLWDAENEMTLNNVELKFQTGGPVSTCVLFPDQPVGPTIEGNAPNGSVGEEYASYAYTVTPGDSPIEDVRLLTGLLPPPATLTDLGVIPTFTPTIPGTYTFQVRATDGNGLPATLTDTIVIAPPQYDDNWKYKVEAPGSTADYSAPGYDDSDWDVGPGGFGSWIPPGSTLTIGTAVGGLLGRAIWLRRELTFGGTYVLDVFHDDGEELWINGEVVELEVIQYFHSRATVTISPGDVLALKVTDGIPTGSANLFAGISFTAEEP